MQNTENKVFEVFSSPGSFIPLFFPWKMMYGQDIYFFVSILNQAFAYFADSCYFCR